VLSNYFGGFLSSLVGGITYDLIGFSWSTTLLVIQMGIVVKLMHIDQKLKLPGGHNFVLIALRFSN